MQLPERDFSTKLPLYGPINGGWGALPECRILKCMKSQDPRQEHNLSNLLSTCEEDNAKASAPSQLPVPLQMALQFCYFTNFILHLSG